MVSYSCALDIDTASLAGHHRRPRTAMGLRVPGSGSGRLSTTRFITMVEVMRWTPGKVASFCR